MTTHSPVVLRELSGHQLFVVRAATDKHEVRAVGTADDIQGTIRAYPDAFLAASVIVCEGASEVGLLRGLDQYRTANGHKSSTAEGAALVDCGGGDADRPFRRAAAFHALGYRTAILRDNDIKPTPALEAAFMTDGGKLVAWRDGCAVEDELFLSLTDDAVGKLIDRAIELHGPELVNEHIKSASQNTQNLTAIQCDALFDSVSPETRQILGKAARTKKIGWFKSVTSMEDVARDILGPDLANADASFRSRVDEIFDWVSNAGG
jgi:hypothetical protein